MIKNLFNNFFVEDLAIDLTSSRTIIYQKGNGICINESSVVATEDGVYLAVGDAAEDIRGKNPEGVKVVKPIKNGVIAEPDFCEQMIRRSMQKLYGKNAFYKFYPAVLAAIPHHASAAERKIYEETLDAAGAKDVHLISSLLAGAYGAELKPETASASIVCNISQSFTEVGIVSMNKVHSSINVAVGHSDFVKAVINHVRNTTMYSIGEKSAERVLENIGAAYFIPEQDQDVPFIVSGMHKRSSVPTDVEITKREVCNALVPLITQIITGLLEVMEKAKEGMAADIQSNGITLLGVGATLPRVDIAISISLDNIKTSIAKNPTTCIADGAGKILERMG
ncbi:rod shape-determining protein [Vibrio crassostreae]|uniref:rod shape-determining protein n=1 Tax=Vibrio crassostreae TaxID=246167 RepID=UPI001B311928|nr:rod shape-determining protein [Vibrio crassostreae]